MISNKLRFAKEPVEIKDQEINTLERSVTNRPSSLELTRWPRVTWERENQMMRMCPQLFANVTSSTEATAEFWEENSNQQGVM